MLDDRQVRARALRSADAQTAHEDFCSLSQLVKVEEAKEFLGVDAQTAQRGFYSLNSSRA